MGLVVLGVVGGIVALLGAIIPWTIVESCASAVGISICVALPLPVPLSEFNPILGIAPLLSLLTALIGLVLIILQKPMMGLVAGVMGFLSLIFAVLFIVSFGGSQQDILNVVAPGGSASVRVGMSFSVYLTIIGGLLLGIAGILQWRKLSPK